MVQDSSKVATLLREQNELLQKLLDAQLQQAKEMKRGQMVQNFFKVLPLALVLIVVAWLYWQMNLALSDLTSQITDIQENVSSVFGLLTDQFAKMDEYFRTISSVLPKIIPNLEEVPGLIKETFLSS